MLLSFYIILLLVTSAFIYYLNKRMKALKKENQTLTKLNSQQLFGINEKEKRLRNVKTKQESIFNLLESAITNERTRIAHELHDDTVQRLIAIRFRLEKMNWHALPKAVEKEINLLRDEINRIIKDTRALINRESQIQFENKTLTRLLKDFTHEQNSNSFLTATFKEREVEQEFSIPPEIKKELFRLTQEAIQNSIKHSAGTELTVEVLWGDHLTINLIDNGIGFLRTDKRGTGSKTMQVRAEKIGAQVQTLNRIGGAQVQIILPKQGYF